MGVPICTTRLSIRDRVKAGVFGGQRIPSGKIPGPLGGLQGKRALINVKK